MTQIYNKFIVYTNNRVLHDIIAIKQRSNHGYLLFLRQVVCRPLLCKMAEIMVRLSLLLLFFYRATALTDDRFYPRYHLAPPKGWMNDPNGFSIFKNEYHLFYQYNPETSEEAGIAHWGHAKSNDLFHWQNLPIAMYPDQDYDKNGVFSGSAIVENDTMRIFYTGNVNFPGQTPDHIQRQALATSTDGVKVTKYEGNPILRGDDLQPNLRDPKVWEHNGIYYMILGNSFNNNTLGRALLFSSEDMTTWKQVSVLDHSDGSLGFMWECPDFFELDGQFVLLFSPQGVEPQGDKYRNLYQTGYIVGDFDYETHKFTPKTEFRELDHGHDFYATQTIEDDGRRIVVAWFDMWEQVYPERADGFTGFMTIPRVLSLTEDGHLLQRPVRQIAAARGGELHSGRAGKGTIVTLKDKAGEIKIQAQKDQDLEVFIESENKSSAISISYNAADGTITLDRGGTDGVRRTQWHPKRRLNWKIYVDASSVELFCGAGEVTFSSRFFPEGAVQVRLGDKSEVRQLKVSNMKRTLYLHGDGRKICYESG